MQVDREQLGRTLYGALQTFRRARGAPPLHDWEALSFTTRTALMMVASRFAGIVVAPHQLGLAENTGGSYRADGAGASPEPAIDRAPRAGDRLLGPDGIRGRVVRCTSCNGGSASHVHLRIGPRVTAALSLPLPPGWRIVGERIGYVVRTFVRAREDQPGRVEWLKQIRQGRVVRGVLELGGGEWTTDPREAKVFDRLRSISGGERVARIRYLPGCSPPAQRGMQPEMAVTTGAEA